MIDLTMTTVNPEFTKHVHKLVLKDKKNFIKDLNSVKALTSGFKPKKNYFNDLANYIIKILKEKTGRDYTLSDWWENYYLKGHFTKKHNHFPEKISCIFIVKSSKQNPLNFYDAFNKKIKIAEQNGLLILFPSDLAHSVDKCKETRITLALDFIC